jgi:NADH-quinone oxidoreductase subunit N
VALLAVASKSAGVGALIRVIVTAFPSNVSENFGSIPIILGIVSILTMTLGNLLAINQNNLKRLLAYSSIAHAGYIIMALSSVDIIGIQSAMFYLVSYLIMNLGAFYCVQIVSDRTGDEDISNFYGMGSRNPYLAAIFTIFLLSLTGIPPFFGFAGKFYLFSAVISKGDAFYYSLAIIGVLNSAISLYYYARIIKAMYLTDGSEEVFSFDIVRRYVIGILGICAVLFGVYFAPVVRLVEKFSNILNP